MPETNELLQQLLNSISSIDRSLAHLADEKQGLHSRMEAIKRAIRDIATALAKRNDRTIDRIVS